VWRKRKEAQNPSCLRFSVKFAQSVVVWGVMSSAGVGPLCFIKSKVSTAIYQEVLERFMLPSADQLYGDADFNFQQELPPAHTAKTRIISDWFLEHDNEFTVLKWPLQSPDLNPIEDLWDVVEREIRIMDVQPTNLQQLRDAIMSIGTKISEECFQDLVESMPRRIKAVLKAKGGPTRY
ncbi:hypothetical protein C0J50_15786, partial [Silurus asotus]